MVGLLQWHTQGRRLRPVEVREISILHVRFLQAEMAGGARTPAAVERHRLRSAGRKLMSRGVERVVLPNGAMPAALPEGLRPVSTLPLRRALAADWCGALLRLQKKPAAAARVLVSANALSGEVVRTVTELALRHRYLLLNVPFGGEELCHRLRREYGVSVLLNPAPEQAVEADIHVAFDPAEPQGGGFLPLYDRELPLPRLLLPREMEERLPKGVERGQLLSALWEAGVLRPGMLTLCLEADEKTAETL